MIEGIVITELKQLHDERGKVMHMLRKDDKVFQEFGEIYFSCTYPNVVKAWHLHKEMTLNYAVVQGSIKLVLFDDREGSRTKGEIQEIYLNIENYCLVTVPPMIWNGFKAIGTQPAVVANCATHPHSPNEIIRRNPNDPYFSYEWDLKHF
jgi:dTDP-4-dehydrorhamnose 3,5-epimerase